VRAGANGVGVHDPLFAGVITQRANEPVRR
jgi:hypothetical protein